MIHAANLKYCVLALVAALAFSTACSSPEDPVGNAGDSDTGAADSGQDTSGEGRLTYYSHIKPIVDANCVTCHHPGGGGPHSLQTYDEIVPMIALVMAHVEAGTMPPWSPDPECRNYKGQRLLSQEQKSTLRQWVDEGLEMGDLADAVHIEPPVDPGPPQILARTAGAYTPDANIADDYRCFLLDATFEEDTFMIGMQVDPDNDTLVHHANMFLVSPYDLPTVERFENESNVPGYPCFGDAGFASINVIGAWVPGAQPIFLPEDSAVVIPKGSRIVMQTHFNTTYVDPVPVQPEFQLYTMAEVPSTRIRAMPFANLSIVIPAGESESVHTEVYRNRSNRSWHVLGTSPHLHTLASRVTIDVVRRNDEGVECLIDIPDWDFNWQQEYRFNDDEWVEVRPNDSVRMTCVFDNSPGNQPLVDGVRREPTDVYWGGRTQDEMCMTFLVVAEPYVPANADEELCDTFKECRFDCDDPYAVGCIFNCAAEEMDCGQCLVLGAQSCARTHCPRELDDSMDCLINCAIAAQGGGDIDGCLIDNCPEERDAFEVCMRPRLEAGLCNENIRNCNVEL